MLGPIFKIGVPSQIGYLAQFVAMGLMLQIAAGGGKTAVAGFGIALLLLLLAGQVSRSIAEASGIVVAQAIGAARRSVAQRSLLLGLALVIPIATVFMILAGFARPLVSLFSSDEGVVTDTMRVIGALRWTLVVVAVNHVLSTAYTAAGSAKLLMSCTASAHFIGVVVAMVSGYDGIDAATLGMNVGICVNALLLIAVFRHAFHRPMIALTERAAGPAAGAG